MFNRENILTMGGAGPGGIGAAHMALATVLIHILGLAVPLAFLQIFDRVIPNPSDGTLFWLIVGVASAITLDAMLRIGRAHIGGWMGARYEHLTGIDALERLLQAKLTDFQKAGPGHYLERLNALGHVRDFCAGRSLAALIDLPFTAVYLGAIAYLSWPLALVPLAVIALFVAGAFAFGRMRGALEERMRADDRRFGFIIEVLDAIHTVKGFGMEEQILRRYERLQETSAETDYDLAARSGWAGSLGTLFGQLVIVGVAGAGAALVVAGALTVGGLLASIVLASRVAGPLEGIAEQWSRFQDARIARGRVEEIFEMPADEATERIQLPQVQGTIEFENVGFRYGIGKDGEDLPWVFEELTFRIQPGETIGVVGGSGDGKTTLLFLMMGVLAPTTGSARIDGHDLRGCDPQSVRHQVAYLPQEAVIFKGTLTENLTMFRDVLAPDALDMAKLLGLDAVAAELPQGFETPIGEGAEDKLPRGTRQRIGIARAMVQRPRVLLFDEANSFIDGAGDAMLLELLMRLRGRVTLIMVTQRPSMLRLSDRVFQIRDTAIVDHAVKPGSGQAKPRPKSNSKTGPGGARA